MSLLYGVLLCFAIGTNPNVQLYFLIDYQGLIGSVNGSVVSLVSEWCLDSVLIATRIDPHT